MKLIKWDRGDKISVVILIALAFIVIMPSWSWISNQEQLMGEWNEYTETINKDSSEISELTYEWNKNLNNTEKLKQLTEAFKIKYGIVKSHFNSFREFLFKNEQALKGLDAGLYTNHKLMIEDKFIYLESTKDTFSQAENF